jgi:hypothetical protein
VPNAFQFCRKELGVYGNIGIRYGSLVWYEMGNSKMVKPTQTANILVLDLLVSIGDIYESEANKHLSMRM